MPKSWILSLGLLLAACATVPNDAPPVDALPVVSPPAATDPAPAEPEDTADPDAGLRDPARDFTLVTCGAHETLDLVGMPIAEARPLLPGNARIILPADVVAQDYDSKRMNVAVNEAGLITKIDCG